MIYAKRVLLALVAGTALLASLCSVLLEAIPMVSTGSVESMDARAAAVYFTLSD